MKVSLKDFITTGSFGPLKTGVSRSTVEQLLGEPETWGGGKARDYQRATIWKYGDVEFSFQEDVLTMIFVDDFTVPGGGTQIELDAWIINGNLTCAQAESFLAASNIAHLKEGFPFNDNGVHLVTLAGTVLSFCGEEASQVKLHALYHEITSPR